MSFALLNNYEPPIAELAEDTVEVGLEDERSAGIGMQLQTDTRAFKRRWSGKTSLMGGVEAEAFKLWLMGQCWNLSFEKGIQGEGGLSPDTGYASVIVSTAKYGTYSVFGVGGATVARYRIPIRTRSNDYGALMWVRDNGVGTWQHVAISSRQGVITRLLDGVSVGGLSCLTVDVPTSNALRFTLVATQPGGSASLGLRFDDVVLFNWPPTTEQIAAHRTASRAFSEAPLLELSGDVLQETGPVLVRGFVESEDYVQVQDPTLGWDNNQRVVSFSLEEV